MLLNPDVTPGLCWENPADGLESISHTHSLGIELVLPDLRGCKRRHEVVQRN